MNFVPLTPPVQNTSYSLCVTNLNLLLYFLARVQLLEYFLKHISGLNSLMISPPKIVVHQMHHRLKLNCNHTH